MATDSCLQLPFSIHLVLYCIVLYCIVFSTSQYSQTVTAKAFHISLINFQLVSSIISVVPHTTLSHCAVESHPTPGDCRGSSSPSRSLYGVSSHVADGGSARIPLECGQFGQSHVVEFHRNKHVTEDMFSLANVTVGQVSTILHSMSSSNATGLDEIPAKYLKDGSSVISKLLTHIINLSITTGSIPDDLKMARIVPLYKKNSKTHVGNYRPISVLSVISKVFEKVVFMQLSDYLSENRLLYEFQSGFRSSYSTDTCLIHLTDYIKLENDKGNFTGMVLLDLQKAFDTVDHTILLNKLKWLGADDLTVRWFRSYLTGRTQVTDIGGTMSEPKGVTCGVPQGSIRGPLLFLLYVNDMASAVRCKLLLYADDSALIASGKNVADIESTLSSELEYVSNWLIDNKLSLHLGKTQSILFGTKRRLSTGVK